MVAIMATSDLPLCSNAEDEYIDMEVSSSSSSLLFSSPQAREFEFQMCDSVGLEKESTTSPADELFYKGKLLPLHLPPRLQMVQKLLQNSATKTFDQECNIALPATTSNTPLDQSCNISPTESCRVSCELNQDGFFNWSTELSGFVSGTDQPKKSWSRTKLRLIKQSSLGQKLRASRAYFKSLFSKSGCSNESCAKPACKAEESGHIANGNRDYLSRYIKVAKNTASEQIGKGIKFPTLAFVMNSIDKDEFDQDVTRTHRKSFSGPNKRQSTMKSSSSSSSGASSLSSSFSFNSNGANDPQPLKRSSSASSEIEGSIEAAIAHCKKSQQLFTARNTVNEADFCSFSVSKLAA
ncbi:probable membrane-associated kinase regulator 4 [Daucus carota subsp. sativus]|uniref:Membrane-associated kinase regulator 4 n=2 Tax=Daucus carota subsp. sativus TaxID=79200 RepID=A0A162A8M5_DAUCS|nr:PREDICTED: probable membrane-associated kinase regulator 4 [Daucus carota subsp. sativus]